MTDITITKVTFVDPEDKEQKTIIADIAVDGIDKVKGLKEALENTSTYWQEVTE